MVLFVVHVFWGEHFVEHNLALGYFWLYIGEYHAKLHLSVCTNSSVLQEFA